MVELVWDIFANMPGALGRASSYCERDITAWLDSIARRSD